MVIIGLVGRISCGKELISGYIQEHWQFISKRITSYNIEEILDYLQHKDENKNNIQNLEAKNIKNNKDNIKNINEEDANLEKNQKIQNKNQILDSNNNMIEKQIIKENKEETLPIEETNQLLEKLEAMEIKSIIHDPQNIFDSENLKENQKSSEKNNKIALIQLSTKNLNLELEESKPDFKNMIFSKNWKKKSLDECKLSLVEYKSNQIIFPILSMEQVIFMRKRNYFHLVYVDTPILMRFSFFQKKYKKKFSLEQFIELDDLVTKKKKKNDKK